MCINLMFVDSDIVSIIIALEFSFFYLALDSKLSRWFRKQRITTYTLHVTIGYAMKTSSHCVMFFRCVCTLISPVFLSMMRPAKAKQITPDEGRREKENGKEFTDRRWKKSNWPVGWWFVSVVYCLCTNQLSAKIEIDRWVELVKFLNRINRKIRSRTRQKK